MTSERELIMEYLKETYQNSFRLGRDELARSSHQFFTALESMTNTEFDGISEQLMLSAGAHPNDK